MSDVRALLGRSAATRKRRVAHHAALALMLSLGLAVAIVAMAPPRPAQAHAFLVATSPGQGERLADPPDVLVFEFSEAPDPASVQVRLRGPEGREIAIAEPQTSGLEVRVALVALGEAVYLVAWEATSAVDGHGSAGEFAFAVGDVAGAVPVARAASSTDGWGVAASVAFVAGLALATGALAVRGLAGSDETGAGGALSGDSAARLGLVLALIGAVVALLAAAGGSTWQLWVVADLLVVALVVVGLRRSWRLPLALTVIAAGVWAIRSHGATEDGALGWLVDFVHLAAGAAWAGSLAVVVAAGWRLRRQQRPWLPLVARYAQVALWLVVALGAAGVVSAVLLVPTWSDLWGTGYGRLVAAKAGLFTVAVGTAAAARWWGLARRGTRRVRSLMAGELALLGAAVVLAGVVANGAPPVPAASAEELLGPPPLDGDVVRDAGLAGQLNVAVASDSRRLDVDVFGPSGPLGGTEAGVTLRRPDGSQVDLDPRPCGAGCFTQALDLADGTTTVRVAASAPDWTGGYYEARLTWPPGELAPDRLGEVVDTMRQVPELTVVETTTSGPGSAATPARLTLSGERFIATEPYAGANLDDVRLDGDRKLTLWLPGDQILATLELDDAGRLARERLVTRGHEIQREFDYPDNRT
ncbi:MAG TPA: copper resistance protein CopC [Acidimicrobiales bacterium]|jgi:copper transport protein|nr:copper resistance protein CopC [Acidimicrobiales bacterium]